MSGWLLVNLQVTSGGEIRLGWTIPKQVGTAVVRNRLRRWGREYLRKWSVDQTKSLDMNLVFKRQKQGFYESIGHEEFDGVMDKLVAKLERYSAK